MTLQHVVLFRFADALDDAEDRQMRRLVSEWPSLIGGFEVIRLGSDMHGGERSRGYHYLLMTEHPDLASLRHYQAHPLHQRFGEWTRSQGGEVLAFDYELDDRTVLYSQTGCH